MNKLKESLEQHVFNDKAMYDRIRLVNLKHELDRRTPMNKKWVWSVALAAALVVVLFATSILIAPRLLNETAETQPPTANLAAEAELTAYAMVSIDINPSFELYLDEAGLVTRIKAKNDDAETLDVHDLLGQSHDIVVAEIIKRATAAGFIQTGDSIDDYVLVSTVVLKKDDPDADANQESIGQKIKDALSEEGALDDTTKVAVIKATLREKFAADGKETPLGLYIINGMIQVKDGAPVESDGTWMKVSEFVRNPESLAKLEKRAEMVQTRQEAKETRQSEKVTRQSEQDSAKETRESERDIAKETRESERQVTKESRQTEHSTN